MILESIQIKKAQVLHRGGSFDLITEEVTYPNGRNTTHVTLMHKGAVVIVPEIRPGQYLLVSQYRHSLRGILTEFPAGTLDQVGESPLDCAKRELSEETGYGAKEWVSLGQLIPCPGFCNEVQHLFLARQLFEHKLDSDVDEIINTVTLSTRDIETGIIDGTINDGKTIASFARMRLRFG